MKRFIFLITAISASLWATDYSVDATMNRCPKGEHMMVTMGKLTTDAKSGKLIFVKAPGRPKTRCVKDTPKKESEPKKKEPEKTGPYTIHIFQYGSPSGMGQTYASKQECEVQKAHLTKANKGLDYTYTCVKQ